MGMVQVSKCIPNYRQGKAVLVINIAAKGSIRMYCTLLTRQSTLVVKVTVENGEMHRQLHTSKVRLY